MVALLEIRFQLDMCISAHLDRKAVQDFGLGLCGCGDACEEGASRQRNQGRCAHRVFGKCQERFDVDPAWMAALRRIPEIMLFPIFGYDKRSSHLHVHRYIVDPVWLPFKFVQGLSMSILLLLRGLGLWLLPYRLDLQLLLCGIKVSFKLDGSTLKSLGISIRAL